MLKNFLDIDITDKSLNASNINNNILNLTISNNLIIDFYLHILQNLIFTDKAELYLENYILDAKAKKIEWAV